VARMSKQVLGEFRGKIGDVVGKVRSGKHYISAAPVKYKISRAKHEVDKRNRFRVNGQFAKIIRSNELLFNVWNSSNVPASNAYNKICKLNFNLCEPDRPSAKNVITPAGFSLHVTEINSLSDGIEITLNPFEIIPGEVSVSFILYISFYDPKVKSSAYFELSHLSNYETEDLKFVFKYGAREKMLEQAYKHKTILLAAVTRNENGDILRWSETVGREL
jgi:hypothetical protein